MEERNFPSCATLPNSFITHVGCGGAGERVGERGEGETQSRVSHGVPSIILPASLLPPPAPPTTTPEMTGGRPHFLPAHSAGTCEAVGGLTPHTARLHTSLLPHV